MKLPWIKRCFDPGRKSATPRPAFQRSLFFERMEERLPLSTTMAPMQGGSITFNMDQVLIGDSRGVLDTEGLSGLEFSQNYEPILSSPGISRGEIGSPSQTEGSFLFGTNLNEGILGGGLEQVTPIEPLEQSPPDQIDGGHIQIARLFTPSFEQLTIGDSPTEIAKTPGSELRRSEARFGTPLREFTPTQGREMAFEVASTNPTSATSSSQVSDQNLPARTVEVTLQKPFQSAEEKSIPRSNETTDTPASKPAADVSARGEEIPLKQASLTTFTAKSQAEHGKTSGSAEATVEQVHDRVFAEWPTEKQQERPTNFETPTAPLAQDREQQVTHKLVLSGVAILSAGIHFARAHNREGMKQIEQLSTRQDDYLRL